MKYKLINYVTKTETFCGKVTIDGFDYYVSDENPVGDSYVFDLDRIKFICSDDESTTTDKKVIATNNPNIDCPKVVDEVEKLAKKYTEETESLRMKRVWKAGYNKSQETHPNSDEDMIEFAEWIADSKLHGYSKQLYEAMIRHKVSTTKELLQLWKEQRTKIVYYE